MAWSYHITAVVDNFSRDIFGLLICTIKFQFKTTFNQSDDICMSERISTISVLRINL